MPSILRFSTYPWHNQDLAEHEVLLHVTIDQIIFFALQLTTIIIHMLVLVFFEIFSFDEEIFAFVEPSVGAFCCSMLNLPTIEAADYRRVILYLHATSKSGSYWSCCWSLSMGRWLCWSNLIFWVYVASKTWACLKLLGC